MNSLRLPFNLACCAHPAPPTRAWGGQVGWIRDGVNCHQLVNCLSDTLQHRTLVIYLYSRARVGVLGSQTLVAHTTLSDKHRLRGWVQAAILAPFFVSSSPVVRTQHTLRWQALVVSVSRRVRWLNHSTHAGTALASKPRLVSAHDMSIRSLMVVLLQA
jgi:hypothetical protein